MPYGLDFLFDFTIDLDFTGVGISCLDVMSTLVLVALASASVSHNLQPPNH